MALSKILIRGAREHNLKNIDLDIPRERLVVVTGVSGSGKSSLAFDTLYAEGQRRYVESLSAYARQFLGQMEKPDVDLIEGLSPAIAIEQKGGAHNPRSTVATTTEIYDYLRLLYARIGVQYCPRCDRPVSRQTIQQICDHLRTWPEGTKIQLLSPLVSGRKGEYRKLLEKVRKDGFVRVRVDGVLHDLEEEIPMEKNKKHDIDLVVDRLVLKSGIERRLVDSVETALRQGQGILKVLAADGKEKEREEFFSENFACPHCGINLEPLEPRNFSFNNPHGACPECMGLGARLEADPDRVVRPERSVKTGAIEPYSSFRTPYYYQRLIHFVRELGASPDVPFRKLPEKVKRAVLWGSDEGEGFEGVLPSLERRYRETDSEILREEIEKYMVSKPCRGCQGKRLKPESLAVRIGERNIIETTQLSVRDSLNYFRRLKLESRQKTIAGPILKEVISRLEFLESVGLSYLSLDRPTSTLSGGEAQRIHLATQIGSALMGVLYILDEPSIGLHQRDNDRLLATLRRLRDLGNTVIVVEHDEDTIEAADFIVDMGPGAGVHGGRVVATGTRKDIVACPNSLTGAFLSGERFIPARRTPRRAPTGFLRLRGARKNNLKNLDVLFPLGQLTCVTGVSGSGKSTLVMETLYPALQWKLMGLSTKPEGFDDLEGYEKIDKVIEIDQSPIGRTPRSNAVTYTGVFTLIRDLFAHLPESRSRGYREGRFSFNVKGGRCEACSGDGVLRIEMHFLPDVYVPCENCQGKRYNRETLEIQYKGKSIADVLAMTVDEALDFFFAHPRIRRILETLRDVGLGYLHLGQSAPTLSGGEAQRVKLASELCRRSTGRTFYILDEPTTGLHFADVAHLIQVLERLVESGNTVVVIEHNLDVIKASDHIIDLGPEGGEEGGRVVGVGSVEEMSRHPSSHTGRFLKQKLEKDEKRKLELEKTRK